MQESKKDKIIQGKMDVWMGLLLAESGFLEIRDNTSNNERHLANTQLKYVQNQLKKMFAFNRSNRSEIEQAETSMFDNVALLKLIGQSIALLPPDLVDDFEPAFLAFYDGYIKQKISEMETPTAS